MSTFDDKPSLPSIGHEISRPSSASTVASANYSQHRHGSHASIQLPALNTLASVASNSPPALRMSLDSNDNISRRGTPPKQLSPPSRPSNGHSMTYATAAPASSNGQPQGPPVCQNCSTSTTPLWRRDESGSVLCNACGLFLKLHGRPRPISLKTDVIKSRNRVKTGGPGRKKPADGLGLAAAHPDADGSLGLAQHRRASGKISSGLSDRSQSPISRVGTPGLQHPSNIAPQHMFDGVLHPDAYQSPSLPSFLRQPSPSGSSVNGSHLEPPMSYDALAQQNTLLRTRVSELEVINGLFQGRVRELENGEEEARRMDLMTRATEAQLRAELDEVRQRESSLKRRLEETEVEPPHKKMRLSDMVDESRAGTPIGSLEE